MKSVPAIATILGIVLLVIIGGYFGSYLLLGRYEMTGLGPSRFFAHEWQAQMYGPAAEVESTLRGYRVYAATYASPDE